MASIDELDFIPPEETSVDSLTPRELALLSENEDMNDNALDKIRMTESQVEREEIRTVRSDRIARERIVYVTIGRMNPPTTGHKGLIKTMIKMALIDGLTQINIILSSTVDSTKNILEDESKRKYLYEMIQPSIYSEVIAELREEFKEEPDKISEFMELLGKFWVEIVCMKDPT